MSQMSSCEGVCMVAHTMCSEELERMVYKEVMFPWIEDDYKNKFFETTRGRLCFKNYYTLTECIEKVEELLLQNPGLKSYFLDITYIMEELYKMDDRFPPPLDWTEYYNVPSVCCIIVIKLKKKRSDL